MKENGGFMYTEMPHFYLMLNLIEVSRTAQFTFFFHRLIVRTRASEPMEELILFEETSLFSEKKILFPTKKNMSQ